MAVINVDDIYILDETGAQVDKVAGLFTKDEDTTSGEKAFAQLNIGTAGSNRNLLDNPWWGSGEVVNQREANRLNPSAYGIDRWKGGSSGSVSVTSTGLAFGSSGGNAWQPMESALRAWMVGKVFTASVLMSDGTIYSRQGTYGTGTTYFLSNPVELFISSAGNFNVRTSRAATVRAVKLELGSVSTLANDAPPNYVEELTKCKAIFERIRSANHATYGYFGAGVAYDTTHAIIIVPMTPKIGDFSITSGGSFRLNNGGSISVTSLAFSGSRMTNTAGVLVTASGLTAGSAYLLQANNDSTAYIDITSTVFD